MNKENLETQCKLLCDLCQQDKPVILCTCGVCGIRFWHKGVFEDYCNATPLRKLYIECHLENKFS